MKHYESRLKTEYVRFEGLIAEERKGGVFSIKGSKESTGCPVTGAGCHQKYSRQSWPLQLRLREGRLDTETAEKAEDTEVGIWLSGDGG